MGIHIIPLKKYKFKLSENMNFTFKTYKEWNKH